MDRESVVLDSGDCVRRRNPGDRRPMDSLGLDMYSSFEVLPQLPLCHPATAPLLQRCYCTEWSVVFGGSHSRSSSKQ